MQVDVDLAAAPLRDREDRVELPFDIAVDADRVEPADHLGTVEHRLVEQVQRVRLDHHAGLRKGDDLHIDPVAVRLAHSLHAVQMVEPDVRADVDMRAHVRRAARHHVPHQARALLFRRKREVAQHAALVVDAIAQRRPGLVRMPRRAPQRLVEVRMAVDEAGQGQATARVDALGVRCDGQSGADGGDAAVANRQVGDLSVREPGTVQQQAGHRVSPAACG